MFRIKFLQKQVTTHHNIVSLHFRFFLSKFFALQFEAEKKIFHVLVNIHG